MVTHDQEEALSVADRIVVMNQGVIEQVGTPLEVYREPASPFVADFVGKVNVLPARVAGPRCVSARCALRAPMAQRPRGARVPAARRRAGAAHRRRRPAGVRCADREDRVPRLVLPGARGVGPCWAPHRLTVYLSLNYLAEQSLAVGSPLPLRLLPERMRVF